MICCEHDWQETGYRDVHVETNAPRPSRIATYLRCSQCGQNGFRFLPWMVVYTWTIR